MTDVIKDDVVKIDHKYIGDGLYIYHDGYHIIIYTFDGYGREHTLYLEPQVLQDIVIYATEHIHE
jgi:hypothetical protein